MILRHNFRHTKTFFQKTHSRGKLSKHYTSRVLYRPFYNPDPPIFGTKLLLCRRFLQHYYRDTFIESHQKPRDVPLISSFSVLCIALLPHYGDSSGTILGVRSVALLQVAKLVGHFSYTKGILRVYKRQVL